MRVNLRSLIRRRRRSGAACVELALVLPLLLLLLLGTVDLGRFGYSYIAVSNAARAGAGFAMMNTYNPSMQSVWTGKIMQAASDEMTGQTGFNSGQLAVTAVPTPEGNGDVRVQVTATYPFTTLVTWPGIPHTLTLSRSVTVRKIR
jgi:Flp pilus assembly protein TadG